MRITDNEIAAALRNPEKECNRKYLNDVYLDWYIDFLTVDGFASYYDLPLAVAERAIDKGREINYEIGEIK